jgi:nucleoside-diphosphate-sugar epimerase
VKKNIWVLGGTGFIGAYLTKQLAKDPDNRVILSIHKSLPNQQLENVITLQKELDEITIEDFEQFTPYKIFHLARFGASTPILRLLSSNKGAKTNQKLIERLNQLDTFPAVNYVSGSLMYGAQKESATELSKLNPVGFAKPYIDGEAPILEAQKRRLNIHFHRPGWILGPSSWFKVFFWDYYKQSGKVPYYGSGEQLMSIISVEDCAGLIIHASKLLAPYQDQNIFNFKPIAQKEFALKVAEILNCETIQIGFEKVKKQYDWQTAEALTTSIPLSTNNSEIINTYSPKYQNLDLLIEDVINQLKD